MNIPTREQCIALWDEYKMPENIRQHTLVVSKIAVFLAKKLNKAGENINLELVEAGALLHDIAKLMKGEEKNHGVLAGEILLKKGFPEVAEIAANHIIQNILKHKSLSREAVLVNYADRRVKHHGVVSLDERFEYLRERYPQHVTPEWDDAEKIYAKIEKEIFTKINLVPEKLEYYLDKEKKDNE